MRTTIRDVAEAAGVSAMAVSAVLHGTGKNVKVSKEKSETIRRLAKELRYEPNHLARSLRSNRTRTVGVVFQHFDRLSDQNPYYPQLLNGVMSALFAEDYTLALCPRLAHRSVEGSISDGRFDGVLWCRPDFTETSVEGIRNSSIPVVMMHAPPGSAPGVPTFCADNEDAMAKVVSHLAELGHRRIGFVTDPVSAKTAEGKVRAAAFQTAATQQGLEGDLLIWDAQAEELNDYVRSERRPTALAAFSDYMAGRILSACLRFGIRVPQELSVVGFDSSSFCEATTPRLTAVYQPVEQMAFEATNHLLSLVRRDQTIAGDLVPLSRIYECGLQVRESTAKAART